MKRVVFICLILMLTTTTVGCAREETDEQVPHVVTADIQAGIEKYIEDEAARGKGYFELSFDGKDYSFKLVRVHTEYLANLGPRSHFACVDLVDTSGDVYDVDFFLSGDPGDMTVTETTLHKLNGIPFYAWEQNPEGVWERVPMEGAAPKLLGVVEGTDEFDFLYRVQLPKITEPARMWLPLPETDDFQLVKIKSIKAQEYKVITEPVYGNKSLFFELGKADSGKTIDIKYHVKRKEKAAYSPESIEREKYLGPNNLVPADEKFKKIAEGVVVGKKGDLVRARALYDHVIDQVKYIKHGEGWGRGDAVYACDIRTGNCTDFHAYFIALARAIGIPARFAIGVAIPSSRNNGGVDGYHCWVEFYAEGKWWPVDISEADKYSSLSTYYFGHHPANRLEFSRGRDLVFEPGPKEGPMNFLAYPILEIGDETMKPKTQFSFERS